MLPGVAGKPARFVTAIAVEPIMCRHEFRQTVDSNHDLNIYLGA